MLNSQTSRFRLDFEEFFGFILNRSHRHANHSHLVKLLFYMWCLCLLGRSISMVRPTVHVDARFRVWLSRALALIRDSFMVYLLIVFIEGGAQSSVVFDLYRFFYMFFFVNEIEVTRNIRVFREILSIEYQLNKWNMNWASDFCVLIACV